MRSNRQPFLCGFGQLAVKAQAFTIILQPAAQGGPFADQRLMRDFSRVFAGDDQSASANAFNTA